MHTHIHVHAARERNENVFQSQRRRLRVTIALEVKKSTQVCVYLCVTTLKIRMYKGNLKENDTAMYIYLN